jgi:hypothetical protein
MGFCNESTKKENQVLATVLDVRDETLDVDEYRVRDKTILFITVQIMAK